jgi:two-component system, NarL family, sensor histidine kinase DegS
VLRNLCYNIAGVLCKHNEKHCQFVEKFSIQEGKGSFQSNIESDLKIGGVIMLDMKKLDKALENIIVGVARGSEQLQIARDNARAKQEEMLTRLIDYKAEILETVTEADRLEKEEKLARVQLMQVSSNLELFDSKDIQTAYEDAQGLLARINKLREKEKQLLQIREQMEKELRELNQSVERAEKIVSQVGLSMELLEGSMQGVTYKLEEQQLRQQLSMRVIRAQEEERLRVAREIHDGPAQSMANVVLRAEICEKLMDVEPDKVKKELFDLKEMVKESLQEVRKIIFDLRPMVLDDLGVVPTLRRFISELQKRANISVELIVLGGEGRRLPGPLEVAVFRIVQEALNNIFKHSRARRAVIRLEILPRRINIGISDDGCGFETQAIMAMGEADRDNYGLLGMRERVELLSGQIIIDSKPGKGTEIQVNIPVKE